jgi:hypothetical protein
MKKMNDSINHNNLFMEIVVSVGGAMGNLKSRLLEIAVFLYEE